MKFAVLPGDGIGPETTEATLRVLEAANRKFGLDLHFETHPIGLATLKTVGTTLPGGVLDACRTADGILLGPVSHATYPARSEEHTSELQSLRHLVCRLLLEKK